jgi:hypothetical protein
VALEAHVDVVAGLTVEFQLRRLRRRRRKCVMGMMVGITTEEGDIVMTMDTLTRVNILGILGTPVPREGGSRGSMMMRIGTMGMGIIPRFNLSFFTIIIYLFFIRTLVALCRWLVRRREWVQSRRMFLVSLSAR